MKNRILPATTLLVALLSLQGCASQWKIVKDTNYAAPAQGYSATLPTGWISINAGDKSLIMLTHDGEDLNMIRLAREDNDKVFAAIKKKASPGELPADLAADFIASVKASQSVSNITVLRNEPASFGGMDGFHAEFTFANGDGLRYHSEVYGACTDKGFFLALYKAPILHYFDLYQPTFESVAQSFKILPAQASARR